MSTRRAGLVLIVVVLVVIVLSLAHSPPDSGADAIAACETFVERSLTSPASAKFRSPTSYSGTGDGPWIVNASVDSQNGFGAVVRTTYSCTVTRSSGTWHLDDLASF